jgi:Ca2+-binding EF-hand superfamily protein
LTLRGCAGAVFTTAYDLLPTLRQQLRRQSVVVVMANRHVTLWRKIMSRTNTLAMLTALPVAVLSIAAFAQNADPAATARPAFFEHMLEKMDTNGDGRISLNEYLASATARFKAIDTKNTGNIDAAQIGNSPAVAERGVHRAATLVARLDKAGNGYITRDEFLAAANKRFTRLDKDGNGKLTLDELAAGRGHGRRAAMAGKRAEFAQKRFDKLDTNHDGVVTKEEYLAAATAMYGEFDAQHNGKVTAREIAASPRAQERVARVTQRIVKHLDTNGDGVVSQAEYLAAAQKRFTRLDKNGDGFIDSDELPARRWAHGAKPTPSGG